MENENLATEMLKEMKASSKRKDIIIIILILTIVAITGMFIWYINQPIEEEIEYTQEMNATTDGSDSPITQQIGDNR